jgi:hypothetical protein
MFFKKTNTEPDMDDPSLGVHAQRRIRQKKWFYTHAVWYLIGLVFSFMANKVLGYGQTHDWFIWVAFFWGFLLCVHMVSVFILSPFIGKEWEEKQYARLMEVQKKKLVKIQQKVDEVLPLEKKKETE